MTNKYIVLRENIRISGLPTLYQNNDTPFLLEYMHLEPSKATALMKYNEIKAIAPELPLQLIRPLTTTAPDNNLPVSWGIRAIKADTSAYKGSGIIVSVLDTGIDSLHSAFAGTKIIKENFTTGSDDDDDGHGTHCCGTFFGKEVNGIRVGVAPEIKKAYVGKVIGNNSGTAELYKGIQWAAQNQANIISMSLGIDLPGYTEKLVNAGMPIQQAASIALENFRQNILLFEELTRSVHSFSEMTKNSITIISAAGNESQRYKIGGFKINTSFPAITRGIVSVAAVANANHKFNVASFSNSNADLSGPGVEIVSAKLGGGVLCCSGTSMAAPHVAGVYALWAEKLKKENRLTSQNLNTEIFSSLYRGNDIINYNTEDFGNGIIMAP